MTDDTVAVLQNTPRPDGCHFIVSVETQARASIPYGPCVETAGGSFLRDAVDEVRHAI